MFRRLYLNSMMVFVYLLSAVTAEPMQVPKEPHAKLRRGLKTVLDQSHPAIEELLAKSQINSQTEIWMHHILKSFWIY